MPTPCSRSRPSRASSVSASCCDSDAVGSSRTRIRARTASARAISTSCRRATLRPPTRARTGPISGMSSSATRASACGVQPTAIDQHAQPGRLAAQQDVLGHREVRRQRQLLVDQPDAQPVGLGRVADLDRPAVHLDRAGVGPHDAAQHLDQRRLPRAVLAQQGVDLAGPQVEIDPGQRHHAAVTAWSRRGATTAGRTSAGHHRIMTISDGSNTKSSEHGMHGVHGKQQGWLHVDRTMTGRTTDQNAESESHLSVYIRVHSVVQIFSLDRCFSDSRGQGPSRANRHWPW